MSDEVDSEVPLDGVGGIHYWKLKVVKSGTVELTFRLCRGDELLDTVTYTYHSYQYMAATVNAAHKDLERWLATENLNHNFL